MSHGRFAYVQIADSVYDSHKCRPEAFYDEQQKHASERDFFRGQAKRLVKKNDYLQGVYNGLRLGVDFNQPVRTDDNKQKQKIRK